MNKYDLIGLKNGTLLIRQRDLTLGSLQGFDNAMSILSINYYN